jgi:hypothetical protein
MRAVWGVEANEHYPGNVPNFDRGSDTARDCRCDSGAYCDNQRTGPGVEQLERGYQNLERTPVRWPILGKDMTAFTNQYGNIDIGRAGCSTASFIANFDEIREALNAPAPPKMTFN